MMSYDLFNFEKYCSTCMDIIPKRPQAQRDTILAKLTEAGEI
jgi:hypothetical protein